MDTWDTRGAFWPRYGFALVWGSGREYLSNGLPWSCSQPQLLACLPVRQPPSSKSAHNRIPIDNKYFFLTLTAFQVSYGKMKTRARLKTFVFWISPSVIKTPFWKFQQLQRNRTHFLISTFSSFQLLRMNTQEYIYMFLRSLMRNRGKKCFFFFFCSMECSLAGLWLLTLLCKAQNQFHVIPSFSLVCKPFILQAALSFY